MKYLIALLALSFSSLASDFKWYKGNTHAHTKISNHGDATPDQVAAWYHNHGYNFLVISEHNKFIDPKTVKLPLMFRNDFILIPGVEVTGNENVHTTALNVEEVVPWFFASKEPWRILQFHVDGINRIGGLAIANHPNFLYALNSQDLGKVRDLKLMELYNGHPGVNHNGDHEHVGVESMWDEVLTKGKKIFGVASDDAHYFFTHRDRLSRPGRGWVMVKAQSLNAKSISQAMSRGDFYATSGVILSELKIDKNNYQIAVDQEETLKEIGKKIRPLNVRIDFIGNGGKVLKTVKGPRAEFDLINLSSNYLRAKVTVHAHGNHFHAWTQPFFSN